MKQRIGHWLGLMVCAFTASAQQAIELNQVNLSRWGIGTAHYSGITSLGNQRYAVVSDKEPQDGFYLFRIEQDAHTGEVTSVALEGFRGNPAAQVDQKGISVRDAEGIAFFPQAQTLFISGEGDQAVWEYSIDGKPTGRGLQIPESFSVKNIRPNCGFEALAYDTCRHRFWTITETMLPADGVAAGPEHPDGQNLLRLLAFDDQLQCVEQYPYRMDRGICEDFGMTYVFGVPALTALPDGSLLVLEREANVSRGYLSSTVRCKLFRVWPAKETAIDAATDLNTLDNNRFMTKLLLADFTTRLTPFNYTFANYEGMCLGQTLVDGRRTLLLVNDSQGGFGKGPVRLKDFVKVLILPD